MQLHGHTYTCTHNSGWLVLGWVTTKEYHPRLCIDYVENVITFTFLHTLLTWMMIDGWYQTLTWMMINGWYPILTWITFRILRRTCSFS